MTKMDHHEHHHSESSVLAEKRFYPPLSARPALSTPMTARPGAHDMADSHADHAMHGSGMSHDMSDPAMAAAMELDIQKRFWLALALSVPVLLISPMGEMIRIYLPITSVVRSRTLLVLTTPIVFWCGWMFIAGAFYSLRSRRLDMSVLIAVGVLAAYTASFYLTIVGAKEVFYEAAAILVTFVLFGQRDLTSENRTKVSHCLKKDRIVCPGAKDSPMLKFPSDIAFTPAAP